MDALFLDKLLVAERLREFSRGIHASGVNTKEFACRVATFEEPQTSLRDERVAAAMRSGR